MIAHTLHKTAAFCFFALGLSFFIAYVLLKNNLYGNWPAWWLQVADLPLIFSGLVFGGLSFWKSFSGEGAPPKWLPWIIGFFIVTAFGLVLTLNFYPAWWRV